MVVFSLDVEVSSHDDLKAGRLAVKLPGAQHPWHRVVIEARDENEAVLIAAQMAIASGHYVTRVLLRV